MLWERNVFSKGFFFFFFLNIECHMFPDERRDQVKISEQKEDFWNVASISLWLSSYERSYEQSQGNPVKLITWRERDFIKWVVIDSTLVARPPGSQQIFDNLVLDSGNFFSILWYFAHCLKDLRVWCENTP